jgi:hypothetical protein
VREKIARVDMSLSKVGLTVANLKVFGFTITIHNLNMAVRKMSPDCAQCGVGLKKGPIIEI